MRMLLLLATLLPLMGVIAFYGSRGFLRATRRRRHIDELERDNKRYDEYIRRMGTTADRRRRSGVIIDDEGLEPIDTEWSL